MLKLRSGYRTHAVSGVVVVCSIAVLATGCGGHPKVDLAGKVTIDGKPVPDDAKAAIYFAPIDPKAGQAVAAPITGGSYKASGVASGEVNVTFDITKTVGPVKVSERTGVEYQETNNLVPADSSAGVRINIQGDNANQDFDL